MPPPEIASVAAFLAWEERQEERYEFVDGSVSPFPGGTLRHAIVAMNVARALGPHVPDVARIGGSDVRIVTFRRSRYADVVVWRDPRDRPDATYVNFPFLIVEVLSESTARTDRGEKLDEYRRIETLEEYVLVDSRARWAQTVRKHADGWIVSLPQRDGRLRFDSLACDVDFERIYAGSEL